MKTTLFALLLIAHSTSSFAMGMPAVPGIAPSFPSDFCWPKDGKKVPASCKD